MAHVLLQAPAPQSDDCHHGGTRYDWILLGFCIAASMLFVFANVVVFRYRSRKFFQGAWFIITDSFGGLIAIMSSFIVNGHFNWNWNGNCNLWTFWLRSSGVSLWFSCIILRFHVLYNTRGSTWKLVLYLTASWILFIALAVVAPKEFGCRGCKLTTRNAVIHTIAVAPYVLGVVFVLHQLRPKRHKNRVLAADYLHTWECVAVGSVMMILLSWVTFLTKAERETSGRCFLTFCFCCPIFYHFWGSLGWPVYVCVFKSKEEIDSLEREVEANQSELWSMDALEAIYSQRPAYVPSSESAALEALSKAAEDLDKYKAEIRELESKKAALQARLNQKNASNEAGSSGLWEVLVDSTEYVSGIEIDLQRIFAPQNAPEVDKTAIFPD